MPERRRRPAWLARLERAGGRVGILLVLLAVLLTGAAGEATQLALSAAAVVAVLGLWAGRLRAGLKVRVGWPALALVGLAAFLGVQLVPMPPALLSWVSPAAWELYRSAHEPLGLFPAWRPLSLDPPATLYEAARLTGLAALFVLLDQRARSSQEGRQEVLLSPAMLLSLLALVALGLQGLGQTSLFGLWPIEGSSTPFVSPLRNANHFAGALGVATFVLLGFASSPSESRWPRWLALLAALVCVATVLSGTSMGGVVTMGVGLVAFTLVSLPRGRAVWPPVAVVVACAVVVIAALPDSRLGGARRLSFDDGKLVPMGVAWELACEYPVFGAGRGAFRTLHDRHLPGPAAVTFTHVENEPLQAVAELGFPAGLASVLLLVLAVAALVRKGRASALEAGAAAAAVSLSLHNLVDFSLQYSGAFLLVSLLAGATAQRTLSRPIFAWGSAAVGLATVGLAFVVALPPLADEEARLEALVLAPEATDDQVEMAARALLSRRPASYVPAQAVVQRAVTSNAPIGERAAWLGALLELAPMNGHAHLLAGEALARVGAKAQALLEWRQAGRLGVSALGSVLRWYPQLDAVLESAPEAPVQVVELAKQLVAVGRADWALTLVERARTEPQRELDGMLVELLERAGRPDEALESARSLRRGAMEWNYAWRAEALALQSLGRSEEARQLLEEGFIRMPGDFMLGTLLVGKALTEGRPADALAALSLIDVGDDQPRRAHVASLRSQAFEKMGNLSLAIAEMWTVVSLDPTNTRAMQRLSLLCLAEGRYDEATRALAHAPLDAETRRIHALIDEARKRPGKTAASLEDLLQAR